MGRFIKLMFALILAATVASGCDRKSKNRETKRMGAETGATNGSGPHDPNNSGIPRVPQNPDGTDDSADDSSQSKTVPFPRSQNRSYPAPGYDDEDAEGEDSEDGESEDTVAENPNHKGGQFTMLGESQQCGTAFKTRERDWYPGLLYPPAQEAIVTGGISPRGFQFSDSHDDSVIKELALDFEQFMQMPGHECLREPSKELAARISNVDVYTDIYKSKINAVIELYDGSERISIQMTGAIAGKMNASREHIPLVQTNSARGGLQFEAFAHCLDADRGCQTVIVKLMQLTAEGKRNRLAEKRYCRVAYIVQRFGNAHLTMSNADRRFSRLIDNPHHSKVAQYLGNTANATCVETLDVIRSNNRGQTPVCAIKRLESWCGDDVIRTPYAKEIGLKTWSVVHGAAKFKFYIDDVLSIEGPLVSAPIRPVFDGKLRVGGQFASGIESAFLMNNDGAGQLNFELNFFGGGQSQMAFSVTSILKDSALGNQTVEMIDPISDQKFVVTRTLVEPLPGSAYEPSGEYSKTEAMDEDDLGSMVGEAVADQQQNTTETVQDGDEEAQVQTPAVDKKNEKTGKTTKTYEAPTPNLNGTSDIRAATTDRQDK